MTVYQYCGLWRHIHERSVIARFHQITMERRRREAGR
jgi:hypothetical protein